MVTDKGLLFIEPKRPASEEPVMDHITRIMINALKRATPGAWTPKGGFRIGDGWKGSHKCRCGAVSGSQDFLLENGMVTNSLAVHYLSMHRSEVPEAEIKKVLQLVRW